MGRWLITAIGLAYAYIGTEMFFRSNYGQAIMYFGYAFGNIGLWILAAP